MRFGKVRADVFKSARSFWVPISQFGRCLTPLAGFRHVSAPPRRHAAASARRCVGSPPRRHFPARRREALRRHLDEVRLLDAGLAKEYDLPAVPM